MPRMDKKMSLHTFGGHYLHNGIILIVNSDSNYFGLLLQYWVNRAKVRKEFIYIFNFSF